MTAYRQSASPEEEVLETFDISTTKGGNLLGFLGAMSLAFLVALGVSVFIGAPPEIEPWIWTFPVGAALFAVPATWLWRKRKRTLKVVRVGDKKKLVVSGMVELTFPLSVSGTQIVMRMNGVPIYHVYLKLLDAQKQGLFFQEVRGAIHGEVPNWLDGIDRSAAATSFDVSRKNDIVRIRSLVEEINCAGET